MDEFVLTRHNVTGATWLCPAGAVSEWAAIGWEPVADGDDPVDPVDAPADAPADVEPAAPAAPAPASKSRGAATTTSTEGS